MNSDFQEAYQKLNLQQKQAVDCLDGPVMVVAGPGTGKTQTLILRMAHILLSQKAKPHQVLALTFTRSGEQMMRERLIDFVGRDGYEVPIFTFHSFCSFLANTYPEFFSGQTERIIEELEKFQLFREILQIKKFPLLAPERNEDALLKTIPSPLSQLKQELIYPEKYLNFLLKEEQKIKAKDDFLDDKGEIKSKYRIDFNKIQRGKELADFYQIYEEKKREKRVRDFDDILIDTVQILEKDKSFRDLLQEKYRYLLADEHQDSNAAQNRLLDLLAGRKDANLFVVGDQRQAIYRFQGASVENFFNFSSQYPSCQKIVLKKNYRSTQKILNVADKLSDFMVQNLSSEQKKLYTSLSAESKTEGEDVRIIHFADELAEFDFLASEAKRLVEKGIEPQEIAFLSRRKRDLDFLEKSFRRLGILYVNEARESILNTPLGKNLLLCLQTINSLDKEDFLAKFFFIDFVGIFPADACNFIQGARKKRISLYKALSDKRFLSGLHLSNPKSFLDLAKVLNDLAVIGKNEILPDFLEICFQKLNLRDFILGREDEFYSLYTLRCFLDLAEKLHFSDRNKSLQDFVEALELASAFNLELKTEVFLPQNRVRLMTAHSAKGREFKYVYVLSCLEKNWEKARTRVLFSLPMSSLSKEAKKEEKTRDENHLFYVALTRAKLGLTMTYSKGEKQFPSRFIKDLELEEIEDDNKDIEARKTLLERQLFPSSSVKENQQHFQQFYTELFFNRGLSPTGLNHYLRDPWEFFELNLLQIPGRKPESLILGTLVHQSLQGFYQQNNPDFHLLSDYFLESLEKEPISTEVFEKLKKRGVKMLNAYQKHYSLENSSLDEGINEKFLQFDLDLPKFKRKLKIQGKIDRLEFLDSDKKTCLVIDYKTGKPKTRGQIEGKTKDSNGEYKRQLIFYQLLCEKSGFGKVKQGLVDFIEPNEKDEFKQENFDLSQEDSKNLILEIEGMVEDFLSFEFLKKKPKEKSQLYSLLDNE